MTPPEAPETGWAAHSRPMQPLQALEEQIQPREDRGIHQGASKAPGIHRDDCVLPEEGRTGQKAPHAGSIGRE